MRHEMLLFVSNLANYIMIEVIDANWKVFLDEIRKAKDLDDIIRIHQKMVDTILEKVLLTSKNEGLYKQLIELFELIQRFRNSEDALYTTAIEECHRRVFQKEKEKLKQLEIEEGKEEPMQSSTKISSEACLHLQNLYKEYKERYKLFFESIVQKVRVLGFMKQNRAMKN